MSEAATVETEVLPPAPKLGRLELKRKCRIAYVSGRSTLTDLAETHGVPLNTVMDWSKKERWNEEKALVTSESHRKVTDKVSDWLAEQRTEQVKRGLTRALRLQKGIDKAITDESGDVKLLEAKDLQALATAEEKLDTIARRNLGMSDESSGPTVNVNVLSQIAIPWEDKGNG